MNPTPVCSKAFFPLLTGIAHGVAVKELDINRNHSREIAGWTNGLFVE